MRKKLVGAREFPSLWPICCRPLAISSAVQLRTPCAGSLGGRARARTALKGALQLAHEVRQAQQALALQSLGVEDRAQARNARLEIGVDDHVIVLPPLSCFPPHPP